MNLHQFTDRLATMTGTEICEIAHELRDLFGSAEGEVAWWRATVAIDRTLKRERRSRAGGRAAHGAAQAVVEAARLGHIDASHRDEVTLVARAAGDVARGLAAGGPGEVYAADLLRPWRPLLTPVAA